MPAPDDEARPSRDDPALAPRPVFRYSRHDPPPPPDPPDGGRLWDPLPEPPMTEPRDTQLDSLRERVARSEYVVDPRAVAAAILFRLAGGTPPADHPS